MMHLFIRLCFIVFPPPRRLCLCFHPCLSVSLSVNRITKIGYALSIKSGLEALQGRITEIAMQ